MSNPLGGGIAQLVITDTDTTDADSLVFDPDGDITSTDVQAAIVEVRDDTDTKLASKADIRMEVLDIDDTAYAGGTDALNDSNNNQWVVHTGTDLTRSITIESGTAGTSYVHWIANAGLEVTFVAGVGVTIHGGEAQNSSIGSYSHVSRNTAVTFFYYGSGDVAISGDFTYTP